MSAPDIAPAALATLLADTYITERVARWHRRPCIFTRRPVPAGAAFPMIIINPNDAVGNFDALNTMHPIVVRSLGIYGQQDNDFRIVDQLGYKIREIFHRQRFSLAVDGFNTVEVVAAGPMTAPVDDDQTVGRIVTLTVKLQQRGESA